MEIILKKNIKTRKARKNRALREVKRERFFC